MMSLYLVIMAGGSGTRFWPKSTAKRPKQLLSFSQGGPTLLHQTLTRFDGLVPSEDAHRMIVTTQVLSQACAQQVKNVTILAEPQGRNTAPCIYWAAREVAARDPRGVMMVMPADHYIAKPERFIETIRTAAQWAQKHDDLVTLGVKPTRPETGYGYLRMGKSIEGSNCSQVDAFVEKPNAEKAQQFLEAGNYLWNGGMFLWRAEVVLKAFDQHMPEMKREWDAAGNVSAAYPHLTATSIDYGIMERAKNVVSFALDCGWDDLGSWTSLEEMADILGTRREGSVVTSGEVLAVESTGNIVDAPGKLVALLGIKDVVVVEAGGVILVADKRRAQDIRLVVERIKKERPDLA